MRVREVRIGGTYVVEVPHELPRNRWPWDPWDPPMWWRLAWLRGTRFTLTITDVDTEARMATGERMVDQTDAAMQLTDDQVTELGLPPGQYWLCGTLHDSAGTVVVLPAVETLWLPTRWLHPADAARPPSHRDLRPQQPW